jgi:hypothetical protein
MTIIKRLLKLIMPEPAGGEAREEDPEGFSATSDPYPEPIEIIDHMKAALRHGVENFSSGRALVPSTYTALIHPGAFSKFKPVFEEFGRRASKSLSEETKRLQEIPYDASDESIGGSREIYPPGRAWVIKLLPKRSLPDEQPFEEDAIEVLTELAASEPGEVVADDGDKEVALTHRPSGGEDYETRLVAEADVTSESDEEPLTDRFAFDGSAGETSPQTSTFGSLRFKLPDDNRAREFDITRREIKIGRHTKANEDVDLRLNVEHGVSEEHLRMRYNDVEGSFEIMDLSKYGTSINGKDIKKSSPIDGNKYWEAVPDGASITLASTVTLELSYA